MPALGSKEPSSTVTCPAGEDEACVYQLVLTTLPRTKANTAKTAEAVKQLLVGSANATVKPGGKKKVKLKLTAAGKRLLHRHSRVREQLKVTIHIGKVSRQFTETATART